MRVKVKYGAYLSYATWHSLLLHPVTSSSMLRLQSAKILRYILHDVNSFVLEGDIVEVYMTMTPGHYTSDVCRCRQ